MTPRIPPDWTEQESFTAAKGLRARHPEMVLGKCKVCGTWAVVSEQYGNVHPLCWTNPDMDRRDRKAVDPNQGAML